MEEVKLITMVKGDMLTELRSDSSRVKRLQDGGWRILEPEPVKVEAPKPKPEPVKIEALEPKPSTRKVAPKKEAADD